LTQQDLFPLLGEVEMKRISSTVLALGLEERKLNYVENGNRY